MPILMIAFVVLVIILVEKWVERWQEKEVISRSARKMERLMEEHIRRELNGAVAITDEWANRCTRTPCYKCECYEFCNETDDAVVITDEWTNRCDIHAGEIMSCLDCECCYFCNEAIDAVVIIEETDPNTFDCYGDPLAQRDDDYCNDCEHEDCLGVWLIIDEDIRNVVVIMKETA